MKSVIITFFTTLMILLPFIVSEKSCLWRFDTCKPSASDVCEVTLRHWCPCPAQVSRKTATIIVSNTTYCEKDKTLNMTYESVQYSAEVLEIDKTFCDPSTCTVESVMCQWQNWQSLSPRQCGNVTERRIRRKCCHPVVQSKRQGICRKLVTQSRDAYQNCLNPDGSMNFDNYPIDTVPRERNEGLRQETKVTIVIVAFAVFLLVAAIIGKRVGRPICERRRRLPVRRNSLPIVLQLPERNQPAPKSVIIPQPGQPLSMNSSETCSMSATVPMVGPSNTER